MNRRTFLKSTAAAAIAQSLPWSAQAEAGWRSFELVTRVDVVDPFGLARAWVPLPLEVDTSWQKTIDNAWSGNAARASIEHDGKYGLAMLYAEWPAREMNPVLEVRSRVMTRDRTVDLSQPPGAAELSSAEQRFHTEPTELIPTDGIVRKTALEITRGASSDIDKARAIYEWIVDNTFRDPKTRGCGWGDIKSMLESGHLGGKCGDLSALFVGLARSVGVPARDVYGIRVAASKHYESLGTGSPRVSKAQHCRAEFFARGYGWVPVDPADVRKVVLEEPPGNLPLGHPKVIAARRRLFGSWEMNWLAYNSGNDVKLPHATDAPTLPYLMYVNAEADGELRDQLEPESLRYAITARELSA